MNQQLENGDAVRLALDKFRLALLNRQNYLAKCFISYGYPESFNHPTLSVLPLRRRLSYGPGHRSPPFPVAPQPVDQVHSSI